MSSSKKEKFYGVNDELWGHKWGFKDSSFIINDDNSITADASRYFIKKIFILVSSSFLIGGIVILVILFLLLINV